MALNSYRLKIPKFSEKLKNYDPHKEKSKILTCFSINRLSLCQIISIFPQLTTYVFKKNIIKTVNYMVNIHLKKSRTLKPTKNLFD